MAIHLIMCPSVNRLLCWNIGYRPHFYVAHPATSRFSRKLSPRIGVPALTPLTISNESLLDIPWPPRTYTNKPPAGFPSWGTNFLGRPLAALSVHTIWRSASLVTALKNKREREREREREIYNSKKFFRAANILHQNMFSYCDFRYVPFLRERYKRLANQIIASLAVVIIAFHVLT